MFKVMGDLGEIGMKSMLMAGIVGFVFTEQLTQEVEMYAQRNLVACLLRFTRHETREIISVKNRCTLFNN